MRCPQCSSLSKVIDSRRQGQRVYRRRQCLLCGSRFSTVEIDVQEFKKQSYKLMEHVKNWQATFQKGPR